MKKKYAFTALVVALGIFLAGFGVWTVTRMITGVVPVQASRIGAMIAAVVSYINLYFHAYQYWKEQKGSK